MSGGSMDYAYNHVLWAIEKIQPSEDKDPTIQRLRDAFKRHLEVVAEAMRAIEWVDSSDMGPGDEVDPIKAVFIHGKVVCQAEHLGSQHP